MANNNDDDDDGDIRDKQLRFHIFQPRKGKNVYFQHTNDSNHHYLKGVMVEMQKKPAPNFYSHLDGFSDRAHLEQKY